MRERERGRERQRETGREKERERHREREERGRERGGGGRERERENEEGGKDRGIIKRVKGRRKGRERDYGCFVAKDFITFLSVLSSSIPFLHLFDHSLSLSLSLSLLYCNRENIDMQTHRGGKNMMGSTMGSL